MGSDVVMWGCNGPLSSSALSSSDVSSVQTTHVFLPLVEGCARGSSEGPSFVDEIATFLLLSLHPVWGACNPARGEILVGS